MRHKWFGVRSHNKMPASSNLRIYRPKAEQLVPLWDRCLRIMIQTIAMNFGGLQLQILAVCSPCRADIKRRL